MDIYDLKFHVNPIQDEIIEEIYENGPLLTSELRENIGKDRLVEGSRGHHPDKLEEWGLIKVIAREGPHNERRFDLTPLGDEYYKRVLAGPVSDVLHASDAEGFEERIETLERIVQEQQAEMDRLEDEKLDETRFDLLKKYLENDYKIEMREYIESWR